MVGGGGCAEDESCGIKAPSVQKPCLERSLLFGVRGGEEESREGKKEREVFSG